MTTRNTPTPDITLEFGKRLHALRRERGWSQPELAEKVSTSGPIIGRYERGDMTPSIEVAARLALVLGVTLDYLCNETGTPEALHDKPMVNRLAALNAIPEKDRDAILYLMDGLIRDAKARQTYGGQQAG
jgi:transcriptional regulator with XRE-family HTH domain